ncbi:serine hydrolase domain-containing protein [Anaeromyxobacter terrae]|uniref:serine hydrolase domain-containing protein n=1 Tax=Anaeromyxobacter terrae TaxID=2925406 RepID=UPI001F57286A|nr:serine hydrolase domain-containing protein [Anaeromyxobacter sp. SG22]
MTPVLPPVVAVLQAGLRDGVAGALSAEVFARGRRVHASCHGALDAPGPRALRRDDLFDVASLTKVMATTTLAAQLAQAGALRLDAPVAETLPGFEAGGKGAVSARHLLAHASGLPEWRPYFESAARDPVAGQAFLPPGERPPPPSLAAAAIRGRAIVRELVLAEPLEAPPGARAAYCDPGFIALGLAVEALAGASLAGLAERRVFGPLGLASTGFLDGADPARARARADGRTFVPTGRSAPRREVLCGAVNDDNAWAMGGVGGHAGLFSTASDVAAFGQAWLDALSGGRGPIPSDAAAEFARRDTATPGSGRALGWDTPSGAEPAIGSRLGRGPRGAIGHLGYTGCSLWIDLDAGVVCALLTNHVHPTGKSDKPRIRELRRRFHDAVAEGLGIG